MNKNLEVSIEAALEAGRTIMEIYECEDFQIETKDDNSPLTLADKKANDIINNFLQPLQIPIISEENRQVPFQERKDWHQCWIVDPLDGTKEFIKRNGEFTVNIALISENVPLLGVIYAPALNLLYYADVSERKAYKVQVGTFNTVPELLKQAQELQPASDYTTLKVVGSRSHMNDATKEFIEELNEQAAREVEIVSIGSSLKFSLVAEGAAHYYPRFAPTMEWDTAAGQAICEAVGVKVLNRKTGAALHYNRENLLNDYFLVCHEEHLL